MVMKVGKIYNTNKNGKIEILKYENCKNVFVKFLNTGNKRYAESGDIRKGIVKDRLNPSCCGIGFEGNGKYSFKENKKIRIIWKSMLLRSVSEKTKNNNPAYKNVTVCKYWHNFQNFCDWVYSKESNYHEGYHLDKDLYIEGNTEYGPLTCVFVKRCVNSLFPVKSVAKKLPTGVSKTINGYYVATCATGGIRVNGKIKNTIEEAELDYLQIKHNYILNDIMVQKSFPEKLLWSMWMKVEKIRHKIEDIKTGENK